MPKVSVIMPSLNVKQYINECMDSVINQTLQDIEIICVDAGSTDGTLEELQNYLAKDSRVKLIMSERKSYGYQMNLGIAAATGEYIGIVETDDYVDITMFETLYNVATENDLDLIKSDYYTFTTQKGERNLIYGRLTNNKKYYNKVINPREDVTVLNLAILTCTGLYKRIWVQKYIRYNETPGASYQDNGFWHQTFYFSKKVYFVDKAFYYYRQDNENSSVNNKGKIYAGKNEYDYIYSILEKNKEIKSIFIYIYTYRKFNNFWYNYNRISWKYRLEFLREFQQTFLISANKNELDFSFFSPREKEILTQIMDNPELYFYVNNPIPIVFSSNNNYAPYLGVALHSLLQNAASNYYYKIYILHTMLTEENQSKLKLLAEDKANVDIECVNVSDYIKGSSLYARGYFSKEMYYRLLIPEILSQYEKAIYLDCDLVVEDDISQLYQHELSDCVMGVVRNLCGKNMKQYVSENLKIDSNTYFNSGVLLLNHATFTKKNIKERCFNLLNEYKELWFPDQDILNIACNQMVQYMEYKWNFAWHLLHATDKNYKLQDEELEVYTNTLGQPSIVHFTSGIKPWSRPDKVFSYKFWFWARSSTFYEEILYKNLAPNNQPNNNTNSQSTSTKPPTDEKKSGLIACIKVHGFIYTFKYGIKKIKLKLFPKKR